MTGSPSPAARSVVLVGFMGVGKTAVGRELARLLDRPFVDTDEAIRQRTGKSIAELFAAGEPAFRVLERACVEELLAGPPGVVSLGGGAFSQPGSAEMVLSQALVVHLYARWADVVPRLPALAVKRPLLAGRETWEIEDLFLSRAASYRLAHVRVCRRGDGVAADAAAAAELVRRSS